MALKPRFPFGRKKEKSIFEGVADDIGNGSDTAYEDGAPIFSGNMKESLNRQDEFLEDYGDKDGTVITEGLKGELEGYDVDSQEMTVISGELKESLNEQEYDSPDYDGESVLDYESPADTFVPADSGDIEEAQDQLEAGPVSAIDFLRASAREAGLKGTKKSVLIQDAWEKRKAVVDIRASQQRLDSFDNIIHASARPRKTPEGTPSTVRESGMKALPGIPGLRVLHIFRTIDLCGEMIRLMDLYRSIDRTNIQFDFLVHVDSEGIDEREPTSDELLRFRKPGFFDAEITRLGGRIYAVPEFNGENIFEYKQCVTRLFETHRNRWGIVEDHEMSTASVCVSIAASTGAVTLLHVAGVIPYQDSRDAYRQFFDRASQAGQEADFVMVGSRTAAVSVFGDMAVRNKRVIVTKEGLKLESYLFNRSRRDKIRRMMGVRNAIIIGCAAVFNDDQNHAFLLQIFAELLKRLQTGTETRYASVRGLPVYLFLAGDGPCRNKLLQMTRDLGLSMQVMYPGICSNMADYYGAMDYYVSVTGCSGVTQAVLEAQVSGLPCLVSDTIAKEANITGLVSYMSIGRSSEEWAEAILNDLVEKRLGNRARDEVFGEAIDEVGAYDDDTLKKLRRLLYADDKPIPGRKSRPVKVKRTPEDEKRLCSALLNRDASAQLLLEIFGRERLNVADKTLLMQRFYNGVTQKGLVRE